MYDFINFYCDEVLFLLFSIFRPLRCVCWRKSLCSLTPEADRLSVCHKVHQIDEQPLLYRANLTYFGERPAGSTEGAMMSDVNGRIWFTKKVPEKELWREYVGGAVLSTFASERLPGNNFAKLKLILDLPGQIASEIIPNFSNALQFCENYLRSTGNDASILGSGITREVGIISEAINATQPIGFEAAIAAQILVGLSDRHFGNAGFVKVKNGYEFANVDYSHSFETSLFQTLLKVFNEDPKALLDSSDEEAEDEGDEDDSDGTDLLLLALGEFSFTYPMSSIGFNAERLREGLSMVAETSNARIKTAVFKAYSELRLLGIEPDLAEYELIFVMLYIKKQVAELMIAALSTPNASDLKCLLYEGLMNQEGLDENQLTNIQTYFGDIACREL